jgi:hypothetical protein
MNNKEQKTPNDIVVSTPYTNTIKLDQDGNMDKPNVQICVKIDLQKKEDPTMEYPHSPTAYMIMSKLLMVDAIIHKA